MGRGGTPAREISFVFLVAYGPKVSLLNFSNEGILLLIMGSTVPYTEVYLGLS